MCLQEVDGVVYINCAHKSGGSVTQVSLSW